MKSRKSESFRSQLACARGRLGRDSASLNVYDSQGKNDLGNESEQILRSLLSYAFNESEQFLRSLLS
jgi:hypothetical protein